MGFFCLATGLISPAAIEEQLHGPTLRQLKLKLLNKRFEFLEKTKQPKTAQVQRASLSRWEYEPMNTASTR